VFINIAQLIQTTKGAGRQCNCFRLTEDKLEDVVVDEVLAIRIAGELEGLAEVHGALLLIDKESTGNEDNDTALVVGGLGIEGRDLVLDLLKGEASKLLGNSLGAEDGSRLESQHRVVSVESSKTLAITVESVVVELNKLFCLFFVRYQVTVVRVEPINQSRRVPNILATSSKSRSVRG